MTNAAEKSDPYVSYRDMEQQTAVISRITRKKYPEESLSYFLIPDTVVSSKRLQSSRMSKNSVKLQEHLPVNRMSQFD